MQEHPKTEVSGLFERYAATVYRRCRRLLGDDDRAKDAVQEVFLRALVHGERFRGEASPMTWLYRVATNHCLQEMRNRGRRSAKLERVRAELDAGAPERGGLLDRVAVRELLEGLDERDQLIVLSRHVEGMTLEEVADVAGVSRKTVQDRLARFEESSRARLGEKSDRGAGHER